MLYVSTRNKTDSFTAYKALHEDRAPDGGMYVPFRLPCYDQQQIAQLKDMSFGEAVAQVLNQFFSAHLNGWDVEFCIGRYPMKLVSMNHRVVVAEIWHNPGSSFSYALQNLYNRICGSETRNSKPSVWAQIAIHIALFFGLYGELIRTGSAETDIALPSENLVAPLAAWYARSMGLPLGTIICSCMDGDPVWDLVQNGELDTNAVHSPYVEMLVYQTLGLTEAQRYACTVSQNKTYQITQEQLAILNNGMYAVVAGKKRVRSVISSVYRMNASFFSPSTALAFGCLQDYRSHTGEIRCTLLLAENSPLYAIDEISAATGFSVSELKNQIRLTKE